MIETQEPNESQTEKHEGEGIITEELFFALCSPCFNITPKN